jgi:hypothetical protein
MEVFIYTGVLPHTDDKKSNMIHHKQNTQWMGTIYMEASLSGVRGEVGLTLRILRDWFTDGEVVVVVELEA